MLHTSFSKKCVHTRFANAASFFLYTSTCLIACSTPSSASCHQERCVHTTACGTQLLTALVHNCWQHSCTQLWTQVQSRCVYTSTSQPILYTNNVCTYLLLLQTIWRFTNPAARRNRLLGAMVLLYTIVYQNELLYTIVYTTHGAVDVVYNWDWNNYGNMSVRTRLPPVGFACVCCWFQAIGHGYTFVVDKIYKGIRKRKQDVDRYELLQIPLEFTERFHFEIVLFGGGAAIRKWVLIVAEEYLGGIHILR